MPYPLCLHIKTNGVRCGSPAITGRNFCFFHKNLHACHRAIRRLPTGSAPTHLRNLPPLEDRESIQISLSAVFASFAAGQIDSRQAYALFSGLQLAAANIDHIRLSARSNETQMLGYIANSDGVQLAADSREPEPVPTPIAYPAPHATLQDEHPAALASSGIAIPQDPDSAPSQPLLIRSCVTGRLAVRGPYNYRDNLPLRQ